MIPEMYMQPDPQAQPQAQEGYTDPTRMKRLGQDDPMANPYMRRMMMAQALGGGGQPGGGMSPMGSAAGGLARGLGQGMGMGGGMGQGADAQKGAGLMGILGQLFGGQTKGF